MSQSKMQPRTLSVTDEIQEVFMAWLRNTDVPNAPLDFTRM